MDMGGMHQLSPTDFVPREMYSGDNGFCRVITVSLETIKIIAGLPEQYSE